MAGLKRLIQNKARGTHVGAHDGDRRSGRPALRILLVAVVLVLLAVVNVANLALRSWARTSREAAVRARLRESVRRLVRQLVIEHVVPACVPPS